MDFLTWKFTKPLGTSAFPTWHGLILAEESYNHSSDQFSNSNTSCYDLWDKLSLSISLPLSLCPLHTHSHMEIKGEREWSFSSSPYQTSRKI
jgi:hypothetical protein